MGARSIFRALVLTTGGKALPSGLPDYAPPQAIHGPSGTVYSQVPYRGLAQGQLAVQPYYLATAETETVYPLVNSMTFAGGVAGG